LGGAKGFLGNGTGKSTCLEDVECFLDAVSFEEFFVTSENKVGYAESVANVGAVVTEERAGLGLQPLFAGGETFGEFEFVNLAHVENRLLPLEVAALEVLHEFEFSDLGWGEVLTVEDGEEWGLKKLHRTDAALTGNEDVFCGEKWWVDETIFGNVVR
jgi:hypothetical protein